MRNAECRMQSGALPCGRRKAKGCSATGKLPVFPGAPPSRTRSANSATTVVLGASQVDFRPSTFDRDGKGNAWRWGCTRNARFDYWRPLSQGGGLWFRASLSILSKVDSVDGSRWKGGVSGATTENRQTPQRTKSMLYYLAWKRRKALDVAHEKRREQN